MQISIIVWKLSRHWLHYYHLCEGECIYKWPKNEKNIQQHSTVEQNTSTMQYSAEQSKKKEKSKDSSSTVEPPPVLLLKAYESSIRLTLTYMFFPLDIFRKMSPKLLLKLNWMKVIVRRNHLKFLKFLSLYIAWNKNRPSSFLSWWKAFILSKHSQCVKYFLFC